MSAVVRKVSGGVVKVSENVRKWEEGVSRCQEEIYRSEKHCAPPLPFTHPLTPQKEQYLFSKHLVGVTEKSQANTRKLQFL